MLRNMKKVKNLLITLFVFTAALLIPASSAHAEGTGIFLGTTEMEADTYYTVVKLAGQDQSSINPGTEEDHNFYYNSTEKTLYIGGGSSQMVYSTQTDEVGLTLPPDSDITIHLYGDHHEIGGTKYSIKGGNIRFTSGDAAYFNLMGTLDVTGDVTFEAFSTSIKEYGGTLDTEAMLIAGGNVDFKDGQVFFQTDISEHKLMKVGGQLVFADSISIIMPESGYLVKSPDGLVDVFYVNPKSKQEEPYKFKDIVVTLGPGSIPVRVVEAEEETPPAPETPETPEAPEVPETPEAPAQAEPKTVSEATYSVIFDANGGSGERKMDGAQAGSVYLMPECSFTAPAGMRFAGWAVGSTDGVRLQSGEGYVFEAETTVYAAWEKTGTTAAVKDSVPKTGESGITAGLLLLAGISGAGAFCFGRKKN